MSNFVRVVVFDKLSLRNDFFTYQNSVGAEVGDLVSVPFGNKNLIGFVIGVEKTKPGFLTKQIIEKISQASLFTEHQVEVLLETSRYYFSPLVRVFENAVPKQIRKGDVKIPTRKVVRLKTVHCALCTVHGIKQKKVLDILKNKKEIDYEYLTREGITLATLRSLEKLGLVEIFTREYFPDVFIESKLKVEIPKLTDEQKTALSSIENSHDKKFLLHGITGSGKTEVYLRLTADELKNGRGVMIIVPEIALTPQLLERFSSRFPGQVAVLHSGLNDTERKNEWLKISLGKARIVIGSRSAVFAPMRKVGLIVIDESHEWTLKQTESHPRYDARKVSEMISDKTGARLVFGSATLRIEDYFRSGDGWQLLELKKRAVSKSVLPSVTIIDIRNESKMKNFSSLSGTLCEKMAEALENKEQIILFLNRRGFASALICTDCGVVEKCPYCDISLTLHGNSYNEKLICHTCGFFKVPPTKCVQCESLKLKSLGTGTEKVERELKRLFPSANVFRMDSDTTTRKNSFNEIYSKLKNREIDILIGTQMIAKGLDLPGVSLVSILNADLGLHFPDFRAAERTFQLLLQVAGRSGRGAKQGEVILQTYSPENFAVRAGALQNYSNFYEKELVIRKDLNLPPFSQIVKIMCSHPDKKTAYQNLYDFKKQLESKLAVHSDQSINFKSNQCPPWRTQQSNIQPPTSNLQILGPSPALFPKLRGFYHFQLVLRGENVREVISEIEIPSGFRVDVDPM